jgi:hypothetical protein
MKKALLTYSIVAWRLFWLTYEARKNPERELKEILEEKKYQVLDAAVKNRKKPLTEKPKLREGIRAIAILGGFLGRKGDGEPGVKTLWRGWQRLQDRVLGWQIMSGLME